MDQTILVERGHSLINLLEQQGIMPRAAMWVHNTDTDTWRLWIVPPRPLTDKHEFYRRISEIISGNADHLQDLDASDIEMVTEKHPAIEGLKRLFKVTGRSPVQVATIVLNGFYLSGGIILQMDFGPS